jgi:plasmid stabilization system protein ParE
MRTSYYASFGHLDAPPGPVYIKSRRPRRRQRAWWRKKRDYPDIFGEELERVLEILSRLPGIGTPDKLSPIPGVRRVYLRRAAVHVYYTFDSSEAIIGAVWEARLEHGPDIDSDPG